MCGGAIFAGWLAGAGVVATLPVGDGGRALAAFLVGGALAGLAGATLLCRVESGRRSQPGSFQDRFYSLFDCIDEAITVMNRKGRVVLINRVGCANLGRSREQLQGLMIADLFPDLGEAVLTRIANVLDGKTLIHFEDMVEVSSGDRWFLSAYHSFPLEDGSDGVMVISYDITERKQAEMAREASESWLKLALKSSNMGTWSWDIRSSHVLWTEQVAALFGLDLEEFGGDLAAYQSRVHPDDLEHVRWTIEESLRTGSAYRVEHRVLWGDGSVHWIEGNGSLTRDENGEPICLSGTVFDVTERKSREAALAASEERYRMIVEQSSDGIVLVDSAGMVADANPKCLQVFRCERSVMLGMRFSELFPATERSKALDAIARTDTEQTVSLRCKGATRVGEAFDAEITGSAVELSGARFSQFVVRDVSARIQEKEALLRAKEKAEESDRLKSAFLANLSHEIRTPLNGIMGFARLLKEGRADEESRAQFVDIINANGQHLLRLIGDMIDIAQIETSQLKLHEEAFDLTSLLRETYINYDSQVKTRLKGAVDLVWENVSDRAMMVVSDPTRIRQILYNLLNNAVKFTSAGKIRFGVKRLDRDRLEFFVSDDGCGIDPKYHDSIFQRFSQVDTALGRKHGGSGLGLAICRGLVELMGGDIRVESRSGAGSVFRVAIKVGVFEEADSGKSFARNKTRRDQEGPRSAVVLVADDEDSNFRLLEELLKPFSREVLRASTGLEALKICEVRLDIDLVLMDMRMPGMNGLEATASLAKTAPRIPVVMQTAYVGKTEREAALAAGCRGFLTKPIDSAELGRVVGRVLAL